MIRASKWSTPAPLFAIGGYQGQVMVEDIRRAGDNSNRYLTENYQGHTMQVTSIIYERGRLLSGSSDNSVIFWDQERVCERYRLKVTGSVRAMHCDHDRLAVGCTHSRMTMYDFTTCQSVNVDARRKAYLLQMDNALIDGV